MNNSTNDSITVKRWAFASDLVTTVVLIYLTVSQIVVLIVAVRRKEITIKMKKIKNVLSLGNLRFVTSALMITSCTVGVFGALLDALTFAVTHTRATFRAVIVLHALGLTIAYMALWLRQLSFYNDPLLRRVTNLTISRYLSYANGLFSVLGLIVAGIIFRVVASVTECTSVECVPDWCYIIVLSIQLSVQVSILSLLIYPIIKYWRKNHILTNDDSAGLKATLKFMKRSVLMTVISTIVDTLTVVAYLYTHIHPWYNKNMLINQICLILCFADWKVKLCPWTLWRNQDNKPVTNV